MHKQETSRLFRSRLQDAMERAGMNQRQLAMEAGVDRSTLSQLLTSDSYRLPRADTVAAIASVLQISLDWLLGLSSETRRGAEILNESLQISPQSRAQVDNNLAKWHQEAAGYKIRYVPASLPDLVKTEDVLRYEFGQQVVKTPDQAIAASQVKLAYSRMPETDMEVCMSKQSLESFARGEGIWRELDVDTRVDQLEHMAKLAQELYPSLRLYLYDGLSHYSVPYTVFGPKRVAIFVGQLYFAFNTTEHIRVLSEHFDNLVRVAVVQAHEAPALLSALAEQHV